MEVDWLIFDQRVRLTEDVRLVILFRADHDTVKLNEQADCGFYRGLLAIVGCQEELCQSNPFFRLLLRLQ